MIFTLFIVALVVFLIMLSAYLIREYLEYINYFTIEPPKDRKDLKALNRRRQIQKHRVSNVAIILFVVVVLIVSFILMNLLSIKKDVTVIKDQVVFEKKKNNGNGLSNSVDIKKYKGDSWDISQFSWKDVLKKESNSQIDNEILLSKKLIPYLGENSVTIIRGTSLTVSVFVIGLTKEQFTQAQKNLPTLVADINKVPQVSIVDFTFTYYDDKSQYQKVSQLYYEEDGILKEAVKK